MHALARFIVSEFFFFAFVKNLIGMRRIIHGAKELALDIPLNLGDELVSHFFDKILFLFVGFHGNRKLEEN